MRASIDSTTGNHTGYRQFKGTRATAQEITDLYQGLCNSNLTDFDVMLSGYSPSAAAVEAVGAIGIDLQRKAEKKPGSFFWGEPTVYLPVSTYPDRLCQYWTLSWAIRAGYTSTTTSFQPTKKSSIMQT